jgi:exodeoxyribonuclease VII small subunit
MGSQVNFRCQGLRCDNVVFAIASMVKKPFRFEESLAELEQLVERMEQSALPLEESLKLFERGVHLTRACQSAIKDAEQKVQILQLDDGEPRLKPFTDES